MAQFTILEENRGTDKNSASGQLSALFAAGGSLFPVGLNAWVRVHLQLEPKTKLWPLFCRLDIGTPLSGIPHVVGAISYLSISALCGKADLRLKCLSANWTAVGLLKAQGSPSVFSHQTCWKCLWYFSRAVSRGDPQAAISVIKLGFLLTLKAQTWLLVTGFIIIKQLELKPLNTNICSFCTVWPTSELRALALWFASGQRLSA